MVALQLEKTLTCPLFLQDTLDCLFQILTEHTDKYRSEVFNVLTHILGFLQQGRFQHFKPVLDLYVRRHFSAALAYQSLMATLNEQVKGWQDEATGDRLKGVFEVLEHMFHFIARSFALHCHGRTAGDDTLNVSLNHFFNGLIPIMGAPADERDKKGRRILDMQSAILKNITSILPDLLTVMSEREIASHMADVLNAVGQAGMYQQRPTLSDVGSGAAPLHQPALSHHKLTFIMNLIESPIKILRNTDARVTLLPTLVCHLEDFIQIRVPVLGYTCDTTVLCSKTVGRMLAVLQVGEEQCSREVIRHVLKLLKPMLGLSFAITRGLPAAVGNWVNLLSLFHLCPIEDFQSFCDEQVHLPEFIGELISVFQRAVREPFFPDEWIIMHLVQNKIFLKIMRCCSEIMRNQLTSPKDYQHDLFQQSFELCVDVITQKCLQMEKTSLLKKRRLRQKFGDLRLEMGFVLMGLWGVLGNEHKEQFIVSSMNDLLKMSLVRMPELRRITLPIIWDVMQVDRATLGTIKRVEAEVLDKLDNLLQAGWGDDEYKEAFVDIILPHCHKQDDADFGRQGVELVAHVRRLIELVIDFRNVPNDDYNKDNRMGCMFNLLHFYHEIDKEELYIRYVYKLSALHRKDERYTEAALTLLLHGDTLKWDATIVVAAEGKYPRHSALARKELLFKEAIQLLDLGKSWEVGIRLCKELATHYEIEAFDYNKLGAILDTQAQFFRKIISELRVEPEYFRVGYYGRGFPHFLRNKEFVHRGLPYEQLGTFRRRLNYEFPNAEFLTFTTAPDESTKNSSGQHLQVFKVNPVPEEREVFRGREVEEKILNYYNCNDLCHFKYDRPYHRGEKDKTCEFATLWIERTTMETSSRLPGVLSYYPVAKAEAVDISPLELAIETVENKNREIVTLTTACLENVAFNLQSLTMILSGVIDAAVNGGIDNYRKIFFTPSYLEASPEQEDKVKHLQKLIEDQCNTLRKALDAHRKRISAAVEPLHNHMEVTYTKMRRIIFPHEAPKEVPTRTQPAFPRSNTMKNRELPPLPVQIQEPNKQKTMSNRPKRIPSTRFMRGTLIQSSGAEGRQRPPPPSFAAPPPPASPTLLGMGQPPTEPYEVVDIDERRRSLTISSHVAVEEELNKFQVREDTIHEIDDYEPVDFDPEEIRRSVHEDGHHVLLVPKQQGDSASVSSGSSVQANSGRATPSQVESVYSFDNLGGSSPPQAQGRPVESMYSTELDKGVIREVARTVRESAQTPNDSQENLYGFDRLNEPAQAPESTTQQENVYGFDQLDQQRENAYGGFDHLSKTVTQENTYGFDHLSTDGPQGGGSNTEESVYFDTLDPTSTPNVQGPPPTLPPRPKPSLTVAPPKPTNPPPQLLETPPKVPEKKRKSITMRKMNAISESSVGSDGPMTPTTPSPAPNGPSMPAVYSGVTLREPNKPPVPRPRSQTESVLQRADTVPAPSSATPLTLPAPSTPPIPRPRQGSGSKGSPLVSTSSSTIETPPALPPKPSQSPPKHPSIPVRQLSTKSNDSAPMVAPSPLETTPAQDAGPGTPPPLPHKPKKSPEPTPRAPGKGTGLSALMAKFETKK